MRAVVYQHDEVEELGHVEPALRRGGFELDVRLRAPAPADASADLVVVMGGLMGVYEASHHPYLLQELEVLRRRVVERRPVLGICLGGQMLAGAAGARVSPGDRMELGVEPVDVTDAGAEDPVFAGLPSPVDVAHWHGDTWDEVPGAIVLATTARYPQAFRLGPSYGVQFHPELTPRMLADWIRVMPDEVKRSGKSAARLADDVARLERAQPVIEAFWDRLVAHFAQVVQRSRRRP